MQTLHFVGCIILFCLPVVLYILYGRKFWWGIYFGGLVVFRAIGQYFIHQKTSKCNNYCKTIAFLCARPAARRASLIISMKFIIESCIRGHHFFKGFCTPEITLAYLLSQLQQPLLVLQASLFVSLYFAAYKGVATMTSACQSLVAPSCLLLGLPLATECSVVLHCLLLGCFWQPLLH